jgi:hypothetical protein
MDRHAAYVALTRHREAVHLYADRQTFGDREGLDKALSRASRKDLAYDYAAADLGRIAARVGALQEQVHALRREEQSLKADLVTLDQVQATRRDLGEAHAAVAKAAGRIYVEPQEATRALLADPKAVDRLAAGEAHAYGELRGHARILLGKDAERSQAEREVPSLRAALWSHRETEQRFARHQSAAAHVGQGALEIKALLDRVTSTLRHVETLSRGPEQALERALRHTSRIAVHAAVSLLPTPMQMPVRLAMHATERILGLGR